VGTLRSASGAGAGAVGATTSVARGIGVVGMASDDGTLRSGAVSGTAFTVVACGKSRVLLAQV
jgi:hypothetical protein